jgi:hypothetical protein
MDSYEFFKQNPLTPERTKTMRQVLALPVSAEIMSDKVWSDRIEQWLTGKRNCPLVCEMLCETLCDIYQQICCQQTER